MRRLFGFPVLAAGLALGAHTAFPHLFDRHTPEFALLSLTSAPAAVAAAEDRKPASRLRMFAPPSVFRTALAEAAADKKIVETPVARPRLVFSIRDRRIPALETASVTIVSASGTRSQATLRPRISPVADPSPRKRLASAKPASPADTEKVTRAIQRQLRRARCYFGRVDGDWGPGTKRAMKMFMMRANASLPLEEPDYFHLSLLKNQQSATCGPNCPRGQSLSSTGRCVPTAILARAGRKARPAVRKRTASTAVSAWTWTTTTVLPATSEKVASLEKPSVLPGRMSIGAISATQPPSGGTLPLFTNSQAKPIIPPAPVLATRDPEPSARITAGTPPRVETSTARPHHQTRRRSYRRRRSVVRLFEHPLGRM
jgi:peptidoglycan hydrolase-like protein with peptidoglycan-binding domain